MSSCLGFSQSRSGDASIPAVEKVDEASTTSAAKIVPKKKTTLAKHLKPRSCVDPSGLQDSKVASLTSKDAPVEKDSAHDCE